MLNDIKNLFGHVHKHSVDLLSANVGEKVNVYLQRGKIPRVDDETAEETSTFSSNVRKNRGDGGPSAVSDMSATGFFNAFFQRYLKHKTKKKCPTDTLRVQSRKQSGRCVQ